MATGDHANVRVRIVIDADDSPVALYIWARVVAATLVDVLLDHGVLATIVRVDVEGLCDFVP